LAIWADPERLAECLDELVANAKHWFDKPEKRIELKTVFPVPEPLPSFLDSSARYVLLHVKDTGCGIPVANKQRIFDAFFTTYDHGTGLGLALVRRIIDGHGGGIVESGVPGQGADYEIYLPLAPEEKPKIRPLSKVSS
jgi:signal transduction histidine kinase